MFGEGFAVWCHGPFAVLILNIWPLGLTLSKPFSAVCPLCTGEDKPATVTCSPHCL